MSGRKRRYREIIEKHGQAYPNFNPTACRVIDEYGNQHGYRFQHALNGGEYYIKGLGYWADGYDEEKNIVFEYNEPHHYDCGKLKSKDLTRLRDIKNYLNCKIIIYNEDKKTLETI